MFIVDGYNWGYGESSYFCVKAEDNIEAIKKVRDKLNGLSEKEKRGGDNLPCKVVFDKNGVSQNLIHLW